jgi:predicted amidohydrolase YtcJ
MSPPISTISTISTAGPAAHKNAFRRRPEKKDLRWRIEHAQHLDPADIPRFAPLGVIASMQGIHRTSDAPFVIARLGPKRAQEGAYVWQSLLRSGALVTNGTDAYAAFEENIKGSLSPGKLAGVVVLSKDIMTVPEEQILSTEVVYTIVGGKIMYQSRGRQYIRTPPRSGTW